MNTNYECFRNDVVAKLVDKLDPDQLNSVMEVIDDVAVAYDIHTKTTGVIVYGNELPPVASYFLASKQLENLSNTTIETYKNELIRFFKTVGKSVEDVTTNDVRCYLAKHKMNGTSDRTIDLYRRILHSFFSWLVINEYIYRNPCSAISAIKYQANERQPLSGYELELIRVNCKTLREKALIDFLFSTGCRVSECAAVKLTDINWAERSVVIRHGKGDKRRVVYFNPESEVSLKMYLASRHDDCNALFVRTRQGVAPISVRSIELEMKRISQRVDISVPLSPHVLRHTFATTGIRSGMPIERLQALMGHSKPDTTLIYAKLDSVDLKRSHQQAFC